MFPTKTVLCLAQKENYKIPKNVEDSWATVWTQTKKISDQH